MKTAFLFPGQGSQSVGMLTELAAAWPVVGKTFDEASESLGYDLWKVVRDGPQESLDRTEITQPAMLAAGVAVWRTWLAAGGAEPQMMAGHSLGEYSALVCAGALGFADALRLVRDRGCFMQEAVPAGSGAMAAILGLDDDAVREACRQARTNSQGGVETVAAVNFNAPGQVVIAGSNGAVERAIELAREAGAKRAVALPVSVPSHCALMKPAAERLTRRLGDIVITPPRIAVWNNVDVATAQSIDAVRDALVRQLYSPVRWVESVQAICAAGAELAIECGPGKVLAGLVKRIDKAASIHNIQDRAGVEAFSA